MFILEAAITHGRAELNKDLFGFLASVVLSGSAAAVALQTAEEKPVSIAENCPSQAAARAAVTVTPIVQLSVSPGM